jgi:arsenate reductase (thioredoxin)
MSSRKRLLFLCTGNSARSQMAEGLLRHEAGDRFEVFSAGTQPSRVHPEAIAVMNEIGIDISGHWSKFVDEFVGQELDTVVTVCDHAKESCPIFPGKPHRLHWPFEDPAAVEGRLEGNDEQRTDAFRKTRDRIHARIKLFLDAEKSQLR